MEDLNKTQIVLICLLLSFVTSIGTGITTVSLLREVPQNVTQTINRVVERTVETIVPQTVSGPIVREVTVVVKEEDLIIDAIKKSRDSVVRVYQTLEKQPPIIIGLGVVVKKDGTVLTDGRQMDPKNSYFVTFVNSGDSYPVVIASNIEKNLTFLSLITDSKPAKSFAFVSTATESPQLGQTVIVNGGKEKESVSIGRVSSINHADGSASRTMSSFVIDTPLRDGIPGSILLNLNGAIVGFENLEILTQGGESLYILINDIKKAYSAFFE